MSYEYPFFNYVGDGNIESTGVAGLQDHRNGGYEVDVGSIFHAGSGSQEEAGYTDLAYGQQNYPGQGQQPLASFQPSPLLQQHHHQQQQQTYIFQPQDPSAGNFFNSSPPYSQLPASHQTYQFAPTNVYQHNLALRSPSLSLSSAVDLDMAARRTKRKKSNGEVLVPYNQLLFTCLSRAPNFERKLQEIYAWFKVNNPKRFCNRDTGWQNSVRHNLSMNEAFANKTRKDEDGNVNHYWQLTHEALISGVEPTTRYRKDERKAGKKRCVARRKSSTRRASSGRANSGTQAKTIVSPTGESARAMRAAVRAAGIFRTPSVARPNRSRNRISGVAGPVLNYPAPPSTSDGSTFYNEARQEGFSSAPYYVGSRSSTPAENLTDDGSAFSLSMMESSRMYDYDFDNGPLTELFGQDVDAGLNDHIYNSGFDSNFDQPIIDNWTQYELSQDTFVTDALNASDDMFSFMQPQYLSDTNNFLDPGLWTNGYDDVGASTYHHGGHNHDSTKAFNATAAEHLSLPALEVDGGDGVGGSPSYNADFDDLGFGFGEWSHLFE